ncbi:MAG: S16 family serine protease [archaeon]
MPRSASRNSLRTLAALLLLLILTVSSVLAGNATIMAPAVAGNGSGVLTTIEVEALPGRGRTLVSTEPLIGLDTQNSERIAREVTEKILEEDFSDTDLIFTIRSQNAASVDGPSAGAAMVVAIISAFSEIPLNGSVAITGTIESDGGIGSVGGILQKARAAASSGTKTFLIPRGTRLQTEESNTEKVEPDGIIISESKTTTTDVVTYGREKLGLRVLEISSINEALPIFFGETFAKRLPETKLEEIPLLEKIELPEESGMRTIAGNGLARARALVARTNNTALAEKVANAETLLEMNYFYTAANEAFLAATEARIESSSLEESKRDFETLNERVGKLVSELNSSAEYSISQMAPLGAGLQRYSWAVAYYGDSGDELAAVSSAIEWISAAEDILGNLPEKGGTEIARNSIEEKAGVRIVEAYRTVALAKSSGADTYLAERALSFAALSLEAGLPLASILDSEDAIAHAESESFSGTVQEIAEKAGNLSIAGSSRNPWALSYSKHSDYLMHRASLLNSKSDARSALFLSLRAFGVETAFLSFPSALEKSEVFQSGAPSWIDKFLVVFPVAASLAALLLSAYSVILSRKTLREARRGKKGGGRK